MSQLSANHFKVEMSLQVMTTSRHLKNEKFLKRFGGDSKLNLKWRGKDLENVWKADKTSRNDV
jgi:hypothetical protein